MAMSIQERIDTFDKSNMFDLIKNFPQQFEKARRNAEQHTLPSLKGPIENIIFTGMGGSAIGGDLLSNLLAGSSNLPTFVNRTYSLPNFVSDKSLVIASSYSGNTEETLSALQSVADRNPYVVCITANGQLEKIAQENTYGLIKVPGGQPPRTALGYLFVSMLTVLEKLGIVADQTDDFSETLSLLREMSAMYADLEATENPTLQLAEALVGKTPIIYGTDEPNAALPTRWRNQMSENAKILAFGNLIPEMNHNEIVGWAAPTAILDKTHVILLRDDHCSTRIKVRFEATKEILQQNNVPFTELFARGQSRMCRTFSLLYYADFVSYYLAVLNKVDPTPIKNIDFLKNKLATLSG